MNNGAILFFGFFGLYYLTFIVALLYTAIIEEWCCRNRLPEWRERIRGNIYTHVNIEECQLN